METTSEVTKLEWILNDSASDSMRSQIKCLTMFDSCDLHQISQFQHCESCSARVHVSGTAHMKCTDCTEMLCVAHSSFSVS